MHVYICIHTHTRTYTHMHTHYTCGDREIIARYKLFFSFIVTAKCFLLYWVGNRNTLTSNSKQVKGTR